MTVKAKCPCGKRFRAAPRLMGKPIRCPFCREKFILTDPESPQQDLIEELVELQRAEPLAAEPLPAILDESDPLALDLADAVPDSLSGAGAFAAGRGAATSSRRASPKRAGLWVTLALVVTVPTVCVLGVVFGYMRLTGRDIVPGLNTPRENAIDLSYLPSDTYMLEYFRVSEVAETQAGKDLLAANPSLGGTVEIASALTGMNLSDVESVTLGYRDPASSTDLPGGFQLETSGVLAFSGVVRTHRPYNRDKVLRFAGKTESASHSGKTFYKVQRTTRFPIFFELAIYFPSDSEIVFGTINEVKAAIERDGKPARQKAFDLIRPENHMAWVVNDSETAGVARGQYATFSDTIEIREVFDCGTPEVARMQLASQRFVTSSSRRMKGVFDQFADDILTGEQADEFQRDTDQMMNDFDVRYEIDGQYLWRDYELTTPRQYSESFVLMLISDVLPIPGGGPKEILEGLRR